MHSGQPPHHRPPQGLDIREEGLRLDVTQLADALVGHLIPDAAVAVQPPCQVRRQVYRVHKRVYDPLVVSLPPGPVSGRRQRGGSEREDRGVGQRGPGIGRQSRNPRVSERAVGDLEQVRDLASRGFVPMEPPVLDPPLQAHSAALR